MAILTSDNIVKLAFSLPIIPILFVIAWKLGIFNWGLFPADPRKQAYDPKTGIGRGAPGFQTNVRRIAVPRSELHKYGLAPEEEERILKQNGSSSGSSTSNNVKKTNEWIPEGHERKKTPGKARKRK
ncbi:hypothetical protein P389DRAFT_174638 [Cystobasidium minutum MCA 4210]|uniref:uncharacterized protein n=1 Tax=Cystobasidium minutum MCA 4210 TaxID=1397322 RepID=UPI0034CE99A9|eukprot:jgi/Rhomi1/174638/fgenesh1_kg.8_\